MHDGTAPAEDSLRSDDQLRPRVAADANEQRRQHKSIVGFQIGACDLSLKGANLVKRSDPNGPPLGLQTRSCDQLQLP